MRKHVGFLARSPNGCYAALVLAAFLYHFLFLRTFQHWWFEDDPSLFAFVRTITNPLRFFTDRAVINFGPAFVPLQALSMWCDSRLAYQSVRFAQFHQAISILLASLLLFAALRNFGLRDREALALACAWFFFPPVIAVTEFLSTRHYLEGFAWSMGALLVAQKIKRSGATRARGRQILLLALLLAAAFSKEVFAITLPLGLALYLWERPLRKVAAVVLLVPFFYLACRYSVLGARTFYGAPFLGPGQYLLFLLRLPYIIAGSWTGYALLTMVAALLLQLWRRGRLSSWAVAAMAVSLASALLVIYPASFPLSRDWLLHGTWYRVAFLLASGLLLTFGYALARMESATLRTILIIILGVLILPGAIVAERKWHASMSRYRAEGRFYLAHPERLLYSELPAFWFLPGLDQLYDLTPHHVTAAERRLPEKADGYRAVWRYRDGKYVKDSALFAELEGMPRPDAAPPAE